MRVVVYNLKGFRLGRDALARALDALHPDLALLQETGPRRALRALADELGMRAAADPWAWGRRRVKNAVLVRPPLELVEHRLERFPGTELLHPRGALVAGIRDGKRRHWGVSAHLGLVPAERATHAQRLGDLVEAIGAPSLVGADLNELPGGRTPALVARSLTDAWTIGGEGREETFPSDDPTARIDYLFVSEGVEVTDVRVAAEAGTASDHLPLVADVRIA